MATRRFKSIVLAVLERGALKVKALSLLLKVVQSAEVKRPLVIEAEAEGIFKETWPVEVVKFKSLPVVEVARVMEPVSPAIVVVVLKFGAELVTVTLPVEPLTDMPAPAKRDCGIGV